MQAKAIRAVMADARGSCRTIGQLVSYARAEVALAVAAVTGDRLAARWALFELFEALGWAWSVRWACWATRRG